MTRPSEGEREAVPGMCVECGDFVDSDASCVNLVDDPHDSGYRVCDECTHGEVDGEECWRCGGEGIVPSRAALAALDRGRGGGGGG